MIQLSDFALHRMLRSNLFDGAPLTRDYLYDRSDSGATRQASGARRLGFVADKGRAALTSSHSNPKFIPIKEQGNDRQNPSGR